MESPNPELRVMLDATILIAGTVWPRFSYEVIQEALRGNFRLILTEYVIAQAKRRIQKRFPDYIELFEELLREAKYEIVPDPNSEEVTERKSLVRDITDVPVALAAINAKVDYLVSEDKDLSAADDTTRELRGNIKVFIAGTFLRDVMGWTSDELEKVKRRTWKDLGEVDS